MFYEYFLSAKESSGIRKLKNSIITVLLVLALMVNAVMIPAVATDEEASGVTQVSTVYKKNYASYYFYNLREHFGYNHAGSCGYVALGMLLAYYDIYWHPDIIQSSFRQPVEVTAPFGPSTDSPGVKSDYELQSTLTSLYYQVGDSTTGSFEALYNYVIAHKNDYLHFYLLNCGIEKNFHGEVGSNFGLFPDRLPALFEYYRFYYMGRYSTTTTEIKEMVSWNNCTKTTRDATIEAIADLIDEGTPVLIMGSSAVDERLAHAMIAYDYSEDSEGNIELYVHMGYTKYPNQTHVAFSSTPYTGSLYAYYLSVESDHRCSTSYITADGTEYCSCSFAIHPEHAHNYQFEQYTSAKHRQYCATCVYSVYAAHITTVGGTKCVYCGATISSGNPGQILNNGNTVNTLSAWEEPTIVEYITANGSYVLSNGVIVLVDRDMQSYMDGSLNLDAYLY